MILFKGLHQTAQGVRLMEHGLNDAITGRKNRSHRESLENSIEEKAT